MAAELLENNGCLSAYEGVKTVGASKKTLCFSFADVETKMINLAYHSYCTRLNLFGNLFIRGCVIIPALTHFDKRILFLRYNIHLAF